MRKHLPLMIPVGMALSVLVCVLLYQVPAINSRLYWRIEGAQAYVRQLANPSEGLPTALPTSSEQSEPVETVVLPVSPSPTTTASPVPVEHTPEPTGTPLPTASPTPLPQQVDLDAPSWEKQDWNNCGPATLGLYLKTYGWEGDQFSISQLLKPERGDRNVNVEELVWWVRNHAGWLSADFRVGGDLEMLKAFIAAGIPIMVEEGYRLDTTYWPNDDQWAGHYLLLTGYDDGLQAFTAQDTFIGANQIVPYATLDEGWRAFNRVFIYMYLPHQQATVDAILGQHADADFNRQHALDAAQADVDGDSEDAFAWFNLGSNLVYFERYAEAAQAYDEARNIGLPQRMLRYQFGPFFAYFHAGRNDELLAVTDYALQITANSEEALLWNGWGLYRAGDLNEALSNWYQALEENPYYDDAQFAIDFVQNN
jgi:hypothetical protein